MNGRESLREAPHETQVAIVKQGIPQPLGKIVRARDLLEIRAFQDAARDLRSAANDLLAYATLLDGKE